MCLKEGFYIIQTWTVECHFRVKKWVWPVGLANGSQKKTAIESYISDWFKRGLYHHLSDFKIPRSCGCKTSPNHHHFSILVKSGCAMFLQKGCAWLLHKYGAGHQGQTIAFWSNLSTGLFSHASLVFCKSSFLFPCPWSMLHGLNGLEMGMY